MSQENLFDRSCSNDAVAELKSFSTSSLVNDKDESEEKLISNDDVLRSNGETENVDDDDDDRNGRRRGDDESNDVIDATLPDDVTASHETKKEEEGKEDKYARLLEQLRRFDYYAPLHKAVCCSLCRYVKPFPRCLLQWRLSVVKAVRVHLLS